MRQFKKVVRQRYLVVENTCHWYEIANAYLLVQDELKTSKLEQSDIVAV